MKIKTFKQFVREKMVDGDDEFNHFIMFYEDKPDGSIIVHHFVGYESKPSMADVKHNQQEMVSDPEFGVGEKALKWKIKVIDKDAMKKILDMGDWK
jgi:hypothetical protein